MAALFVVCALASYTAQHAAVTSWSMDITYVMGGSRGASPNKRRLMLLSIPNAPTPLSDPRPIAVLASGQGSNLAAIHAAIEAKQLNAQIVAVICNEPEAGVIALAKRLGLRCIVSPHRGFTGGRTAYDAALAQTLREVGARWVIMAGWMRIVTAALIDAFPGRILNLHPSLLPAFPGLHAHQQALDAGVCITGCTIHRVVQDLDAGPIIAQAAVCVLPDDSPDSLLQRIHQAEHTLYPRAIALALSLDEP